MEIKINMGCGKRNFGKDWIHIDGADFPHIDSKNITELKFADNTVDLIYSSHVIEYFDRGDVVPLLKEWIRVLKPNGILRLAVPDFRAMAVLYIMNKYSLDSFLGPLYGKMDTNGEKIYHKTVYDWDSLKSVLESIGLTSIRGWRWQNVDHGKFDDHSQAYLPHMDKKRGILISLNIEGVKA